MVYPSKHISLSVQRPMMVVYNFASNPENLPLWAEGLSRSTVTKMGDFWIADSPMGQVKIRFTKMNDFGVMDHDVILPSGETNHNPFRVIQNGEGSELVFTLYRLPHLSDSEFEDDANMVKMDLQRLKRLLESK